MRVLVLSIFFVFSGVSFSNDYSSLKNVSPISSEVDKRFSSVLGSVSDDSKVLLQFWASWCHSCSGVMYDLDKITSAENAGELYFAISLDEDIETARSYIINNAVFSDNKSRFWFDLDGEAEAFYSVDSIPTIIVVDGAGEVLWRKSGHMNSKDFLELANYLNDGNSQ